MAKKHIMIDDIITEQRDRMQNLKKYYPFFVLYENTFSQYKEGKYSELDMGYITLASIRFLINENNFQEKDISYDEYEEFLIELIDRDFKKVMPEGDSLQDKKELVHYIFDKLKNDGKAFEFGFYDPEYGAKRVSRVKLIESIIKDGRVLYHVTSDGIEFYLDTKEIKDESKINIEQLLLEKMIHSNNFKGGIDVVKRINNEVRQLLLMKEDVIRLLSIDIYEGANALRRFMDKTAVWFTEEQKQFAKNKALVAKAVERLQFENINGGASERKAFEDISALDTELKKTIQNHSELITETARLSKLSGDIIERAKLKKLRPVFDFNESLNRIMHDDNPGMMQHILTPLFAPKTYKTFSITSIDNILSLKTDDRLKGEKIGDERMDASFVYQDELLDQSIGRNFAMLFTELLLRLERWKEISVKELNAILEIKFGKDIYLNRDYYSFLVNLAGKESYSMKKLLAKQDTMLEEYIFLYMDEAAKEKYGEYAFDIEYKDELIPLSDDEENERYISEFVIRRIENGV